jgi:hypothetical protein
MPERPAGKSRGARKQQFFELFFRALREEISLHKYLAMPQGRQGGQIPVIA